MKYKYILIDGTNLLWRSIFNNIDTMSNNKKISYSGGIQQFIERSKQLLFRFGYEKSTICYFLFDNPQSKGKIRKSLSEGEYKSHRLKKSTSLHILEISNILVDVLKNFSDNFRILGGKQDVEDLFYQLVQKYGLEADDLTKPIIDTLELNDFNKALCISADLDWARNIDKYVDWFNYKDVYNIQFFKDKYKFEPCGNKIKMFKALKGDTSDNIVNAVPNLNEDVLLHIIENFNTPQELYSNLWKQDYSKHWKGKIQEAERQVKINYNLVDFLPIKEPINNLIRVGKRNEKMLRVWYEGLKIPLDISLQTKEEIKDSFLTPKNYPRRK